MHGVCSFFSPCAIGGGMTFFWLFGSLVGLPFCITVWNIICMLHLFSLWCKIRLSTSGSSPLLNYNSSGSFLRQSPPGSGKQLACGPGPPCPRFAPVFSHPFFRRTSKLKIWSSEIFPLMDFVNLRDFYGNPAIKNEEAEVFCSISANAITHSCCFVFEVDLSVLPSMPSLLRVLLFTDYFSF